MRGATTWSETALCTCKCPTRVPPLVALRRQRDAAVAEARDHLAQLTALRREFESLRKSLAEGMTAAALLGAEGGGGRREGITGGGKRRAVQAGRAQTGAPGSPARTSRFQARSPAAAPRASPSAGARQAPGTPAAAADAEREPQGLGTAEAPHSVLRLRGGGGPWDGAGELGTVEASHTVLRLRGGAGLYPAPFTPDPEFGLPATPRDAAQTELSLSRDALSQSDAVGGTGLPAGSSGPSPLGSARGSAVAGRRRGGFFDMSPAKTPEGRRAMRGARESTGAAHGGSRKGAGGSRTPRGGRWEAPESSRGEGAEDAAGVGGEPRVSGALAEDAAGARSALRVSGAVGSPEASGALLPGLSELGSAASVFAMSDARIDVGEVGGEGDEVGGAVREGGEAETGGAQATLSDLLGLAEESQGTSESPGGTESGGASSRGERRMGSNPLFEPGGVGEGSGGREGSDGGTQTQTPTEDLLARVPEGSPGRGRSGDGAGVTSGVRGTRQRLFAEALRPVTARAEGIDALRTPAGAPRVPRTPSRLRQPGQVTAPVTVATAVGGPTVGDSVGGVVGREGQSQAGSARYDGEQSAAAAEGALAGGVGGGMEGAEAEAALAAYRAEGGWRGRVPEAFAQDLRVARERAARLEALVEAAERGEREARAGRVRAEEVARVAEAKAEREVGAVSTRAEVLEGQLARAAEEAAALRGRVAALEGERADLTAALVAAEAGVRRGADGTVVTESVRVEAEVAGGARAEAGGGVEGPGSSVGVDSETALLRRELAAKEVALANALRQVEALTHMRGAVAGVERAGADAADGVARRVALEHGPVGTGGSGLPRVRVREGVCVGCGRGWRRVEGRGGNVRAEAETGDGEGPGPGVAWAVATLVAQAMASAARQPMLALRREVAVLRARCERLSEDSRREREGKAAAKAALREVVDKVR